MGQIKCDSEEEKRYLRKARQSKGGACVGRGWTLCWTRGGVAWPHGGGGLRHAEFITVPASINVACLGGRDFDGPRTLLAVGSSPRDCPPMTPTHHPTGLPGPAGGGEQSRARPTAQPQPCPPSRISTVRIGNRRFPHADTPAPAWTIRPSFCSPHRRAYTIHAYSGLSTHTRHACEGESCGV